MDLSKAFDTVSHLVLLKKLKIYGANTPNLAWFVSYLNVIKQHIKITQCTDAMKEDIMY